MYVRKALSFLDGGNAPFIGLLLLIGELKQVMNHVLFGALQYVNIMVVFGWKENNFFEKSFFVKNTSPRKLIVMSYFLLFGTR